MNKKIILGFDFDKVFVNYPPFVPSALINRLYKKKSKVLSYRIPGTFERHVRIVSHLPFFRSPMEQNIRSLEMLSKKTHVEMHIISSRFSFLKRLTNYWIEKNNFKKYFKSINFNFEDEQPHKFKERILKKLNVNIFVDDDLDLLKYLAPRHPSIKFYHITDKLTNEKLLPNITQINTIADLLKYIS